MSSSKFVILKLDARNAFNMVDRSNALEAIYQKNPELYLSCLNVYGQPSYTVINDVIVPVEVGTSQGCPLAGSFFNIGTC